MSEVAEEKRTGVSDMGTYQGAPGAFARDIGVLDLVGVSPEGLATIESISDVGTVLIEEGQETALQGASMRDVGTVVTIPKGTQVLIEPWTEFDSEMLEAMQPAQKLAVVGIAIFRPNVSPAMVAEKIEFLTVVGITFATSKVRGALMGRSKSTGSFVSIPEEIENVVHWMGETTVSAAYLDRLPDRSLVLSVGKTRFEKGIDESLFDRKVACYCNVGLTEAPEAIIDLVRARASANLGKIVVPD